MASQILTKFCKHTGSGACQWPHRLLHHSGHSFGLIKHMLQRCSCFALPYRSVSFLSNRSGASFIGRFNLPHADPTYNKIGSVPSRCCGLKGLLPQAAVGIITLGVSTGWISHAQQSSSDTEGSEQGTWTASSYAKIAVVTLFGGLLAGEEANTLSALHLSDCLVVCALSGLARWPLLQLALVLDLQMIGRKL